MTPGINWLSPGIYEGIAAEDYHAAGITKQPALSASIARILIARSPLHAWTAHPQLNPNHRREERDTFDLGSAAHIMLLEPSRAEKVLVVDANDWRTKVAKAAKEAAHEEGLIPILSKDWQRTAEMADAIRRQLPGMDVSPPLFDDGEAETTLVWEQEGVTCKARLDFLHHDLSAIDDLKTTPSKGGTANPQAWSRRTFWSIGADVEAYFHAMGVHALTGVWPHFRFVVCECFPPYAISVIDLSAAAWELAQRKVQFALRKWKRCLEEDDWPAYTREVTSVDLDGWQEADLLRLTYAEEAMA